MKVIDWLVKNKIIESKSKAKQLFKAGAIDLLDKNFKFKYKLSPDEQIPDNAIAENALTNKKYD